MSVPAITEVTAAAQADVRAKTGHSSGSRKLLTPEELQAQLLARAPKLRALLQARIMRSSLKTQGEVHVEDVLQEVFLAAFRGIDTLRDTNAGSIDGWLTSIAQRTLINVIKAAQCIKRGGQAVRQTELQQERYSSIMQLWDAVSAPGKSPISEVAAAEACDRMQIALAQLTDDRRRVVSMRFLEGKSCDEIATLMERSKSSVRNLLFNGLRQLRKNLGSSSKYLSGDSGDSDSEPYLEE